MISDQPTPKDHILDCGERLVATKGFVGVGLAEILAAAAVPKGSFYHYFSSKERFGEELLARHLQRYLHRLDLLLKADGTTARQRLMRYWSYWNTTQCGIGEDVCAATGAVTKCLIVKLSAEVSDISDVMRHTLRDGTDRVLQRIAQCIEEGRAEGSLPVTLHANDTALTLYELWLGASLLAMLRRDSSAFEHATHSTELLLS